MKIRLRFFIVTKIGHHKRDDDYYQENTCKSLNVIWYQSPALDVNSTTAFEQIINTEPQRIVAILESGNLVFCRKIFARKRIPNTENKYKFHHIDSGQHQNSNVICRITAEHMVCDPHGNHILP
jgi:hypothetical protein